MARGATCPTSPPLRNGRRTPVSQSASLHFKETRFSNTSHDRRLFCSRSILSAGKQARAKGTRRKSRKSHRSFSPSLRMTRCFLFPAALQHASFFFSQPSDGDLFDEAMDGGQVNVNGRGDSSPEPFELSALVEGLPAPSPRKCRTPESFLDPNAASLVNLEALIPSNPSSKTTNPFLAGNC